MIRKKNSEDIKKHYLAEKVYMVVKRLECLHRINGMVKHLTKYD